MTSVVMPGSEICVPCYKLGVTMTPIAPIILYWPLFKRLQRSQLTILTKFSQIGVHTPRHTAPILESIPSKNLGGI